MTARGARPPVAIGRGRQADRLQAEALGSLRGFLEDGRICLAGNAADRALRGFALAPKVCHFAGSERAADRAASMAGLIGTAKLNDVDPQVWLADLLGRIAALPQPRLEDLLPWNRKASAHSVATA